MTPSSVRPYALEEATTHELSEAYQAFHPFLYSLDASLPIIDLQQQKYWLPNSRKGAKIPFMQIRQGGLLRYWYWFQSIAGWILTSLWVLAFTGIVRR